MSARHTRLGVALVVAFAVEAAASLPDPSAPGPHPVGYTRTTYARGERRLDTVIWYPAAVAGQPGDALGARDVAVARGRHPVLVYSHGGCAYPEVSSFLTVALASWGFVVVAPTHPGDTVFDGLDVCDAVELRGATLVERVDDVAVVLEAFLRQHTTRGARFFRRLRRSRIGLLGWSSGASTALVAGRETRHLRGVLSLAPDARPERIGTTPVGAPTMVMVGALDYYDPQQTSLDRVYGILEAPRYAVHLRRTGHFAFSDSCLPLPGGRDCEAGALAQDEAHRVVLRFAVPFLLRHVDGATRWRSLLRPDAVVADAELRAEQRRRSATRP